ncbi:hypothetical protein ACMX2H_18520 [Arthrobacter sulfonylureivorans]|uniref:hypothetical protein n=1 Tax=Arthrobacter sulfonylureivorans TaxID=2486855 RepID=UPI0039E23F66
MSRTFQIRLTLELEDGPNHAVLRRVAEIAQRLTEVAVEEYAPDNPTSDEEFMRYDGLESPFLLSAKAQPAP